MRKSNIKKLNKNIQEIQNTFSNSTIVDNKIIITIDYNNTDFNIISDLKGIDVKQEINILQDKVITHKSNINDLFHNLKNDYNIDDTIILQHMCVHEYGKKKLSKIRAFIEKDLQIEAIKNEITLFEEFNDYQDIFFRARNRKRKIICYLGETNSGKTFNAMSEIANSFSSAYLAPLRLLALETYEYLNKQGIPTSLITGEEKIHTDDPMCVSSTVECFNFEKDYDTVVIDEIQMLDDPDRGSFFVQALVGANADNIVVTGPKEYAERLKYIAEYLGEEIEIHEFTRKTEIKPLNKPTPLSKVQPGTAIIVFSRRDIFKIRKELPPNIKSSVIYGALGYEVRKLQAEQFINGETDVLITTDAIGMGLNLPIETVIFTTDSKFNGTNIEKVSHMLTKQICGRAGRYGKYDVGYYGALDRDIMEHLKGAMNHKLRVIPDKQLNVLPTSEYIEVLLDKYNLSTILEMWSRKSFTGELFDTQDLESKIIIAKYLEKKFPDKVKDYYKLINCPIDFNKDYEIFTSIVKQMFENDYIIKKPDVNLFTNIMELEKANKEMSILLWFAFQFPEHCEDDMESFIFHVKDQMNEINTALHTKLTKH